MSGFSRNCQLSVPGLKLWTAVFPSVWEGSVFSPWMAVHVHRCLFLSSPVGPKNSVGELFWEAELCLFHRNVCCLCIFLILAHFPACGWWWVHPFGRWGMEPGVSPAWQSRVGISHAVCGGFVRLLPQKTGHYFLALFEGELVLLSK